MISLFEVFFIYFFTGFLNEKGVTSFWQLHFGNFILATSFWQLQLQLSNSKKNKFLVIFFN
jgi:hypothetical protein